MSGWRIALKVSEHSVPHWQEALEQHCSAVSSFEHDARFKRWLLEGYCEAKPDDTALLLSLSVASVTAGEAVPPYTVEALPDWDWVLENQKHFPPIRCGRFYIYGSHIETPPPFSCLPLRIDAATAFGTGEHPTTQGCLEALSWLRQRDRRLRHALDVGCGTGVLAMGAARLWPGIKAIGGDLHAPSVTVARQNARDNGLRRLHYVVASGARHRQMQASSPYPLVMANILASPLCHLAPTITRATAAGGMIILSGLLQWQQNQVCHAYRKQGVRLRKVFLRANWATLVFQKPVQG
jgi:ribosomal protein L11 methyltransferase